MSSGNPRGERIPTGAPPAPNPHERIPTVAVDNEVVWVNEEILLPFKIELGTRCNLGIFLSPTDIGDALPLTGMKKHGRSGLVARVVFKDKDGRLYRDVNAKGAGGIQDEEDGTYSVVPLGYGEEMETGSYGISDWQYAEQDRVKSEFLLKKGLRTHRTIAILKLKELLTYGGTKISVEDAQELGYLNEGEQPVIQLRAYGTQARIDNASDQEFALTKDAIALVGQEIGRKNLEVTEYLRWFATTLGEQIAIMHTWNHCHRFLIGHNVTLDCRITDLDTAGAFTSDPDERREEAEGDAWSAAEALQTLRSSLTQLWLEEQGLEESGDDIQARKLAFANELGDLYFRAYRDRLNNKRLLEDASFMRAVEEAINTPLDHL